jgi:putative transcriptional regulator
MLHASNMFALESNRAIRALIPVIRFRLRELIADLEFRRGTRVKLEDIARDSGIHRATLYKIGSKRGYNTTTDNLSKLCRYFNCALSDVAQYVPDEVVMAETTLLSQDEAPIAPSPAKKSKAKQPRS